MVGQGGCRQRRRGDLVVEKTVAVNPTMRARGPVVSDPEADPAAYVAGLIGQDDLPAVGPPVVIRPAVSIRPGGAVLLADISLVYRLCCGKRIEVPAGGSGIGGRRRQEGIVNIVGKRPIRVDFLFRV